MQGPSARLQEHWEELKNRTAERMIELEKEIKQAEADMRREKEAAEPQRRDSLEALTVYPPKDCRFGTLNFKVPSVLIFRYWAKRILLCMFGVFLTPSLFSYTWRK